MAMSAPAQRYGESIGQRRFRGDFAQIDAKMDDRLRNLRPDSADHAIGAHQARRRHGFQKVLGHQRIYNRHAGDIDNGEIGAGLHDRFEQILHHDLRPRAVQRAD